MPAEKEWEKGARPSLMTEEEFKKESDIANKIVDISIISEEDSAMFEESKNEIDLLMK